MNSFIFYEITRKIIELTWATRLKLISKLNWIEIWYEIKCYKLWNNICPTLVPCWGVPNSCIKWNLATKTTLYIYIKNIIYLYWPNVYSCNSRYSLIGPSYCGHIFNLGINPHIIRPHQTMRLLYIKRTLYSTVIWTNDYTYNTVLIQNQVPFPSLTLQKVLNKYICAFLR